MRILGITVSIFIGFRNTQAISRWWEARKLWGSIVNVSRNWHDNLSALLTPATTQIRRGQHLLMVQVATVWQLNFELRNFWHRELMQLQGEVFAELKLTTTPHCAIWAKSAPGRFTAFIRTAGSMDKDANN